MTRTQQRLDYNRALPIFVLVLVDVLGLTIILPLLHLYAAAYGAGPLEIGLVVAAFPLAQLVGLPLMGALSDRYGRKPLLLISQISTCIGFVMLGLADSLAIIVLARVIDGVFGANLSTAQAALSDITSPETRAQGLGLTGAAFGLGFILGPVIALGALEVSDSLALPAFIAAGYSFLSILLTTFLFRETLPPEQRRARRSTRPLASILRLFRVPQVNILLLVMFAQQLVFFGFESLLGLFTLSRLGLLGQGNALVFILVGVVLVTVQLRGIGRWTRKYGERRVVLAALALLGVGLILLAFTPEQPHPFYVRQMVENRLRAQDMSGTEAIIGQIAVPLPAEGHNGVGGLLWLLVVIVPLAAGAGLIRPGLNSLMTRRVSPADYGSVLGVSASVVSAANAAAPIAGGLLFQHYGSTVPFLLGGAILLALLAVSVMCIKPLESPAPTAVQSGADPAAIQG